MEAKDWSLEREIIRLTHAASLNEGLFRLGIISNPTSSFKVRHDPTWVRGGAETYIFRFWVEEEAQPVRGFIIKACVAFSFSVSLEMMLQAWIERREILSRSGISTPTLLFHGEGVVIEEFIPLTIVDAINNSDPESLCSILRGLARLAAAYSFHGFSPVQGFADLRSRDRDVVIIDFGADLGPPRALPPGNDKVFNDLLRQLAEWKVELENEDRENMLATFLAEKD